MQRSLLRVAAPVACLLLGGCAVGSGGTPTGVQLTITRDFGSGGLAEIAAPVVHTGDTAVRMLGRNARVSSSTAAGPVTAIDGLAAGPQAGRPTGWSYFVNGIAPTRSDVSSPLRSGDHVWWDRHDSGGAPTVPAVVGSFPEPFLHGTGGKRLPVRIECIDPASPTCTVVSRALTRLGIPAARGGLGLAEHDDALRVLVGAWTGIRTDAAARRLETGPQASGVYARVADGGHSLVLLDARGAALRTLGPGSGLVAATRLASAPPVWVVTGTDAAGIASAAKAFEAGALHDRFALAVSNDLGVALPVGGQ